MGFLGFIFGGAVGFGLMYFLIDNSIIIIEGDIMTGALGVGLIYIISSILIGGLIGYNLSK